MSVIVKLIDIRPFQMIRITHKIHTQKTLTQNWNTTFSIYQNLNQKKTMCNCRPAYPLPYRPLSAGPILHRSHYHHPQHHSSLRHFGGGVGPGATNYTMNTTPSKTIYEKGAKEQKVNLFYYLSYYFYCNIIY